MRTIGASASGISGKRVLIIGGAGFLGTHVRHRLEGSNEITVIDRRDPPALSNRETTFLRASAADRATFQSLRQDFDLVFQFGSTSSVVDFKKDVALHTTESIASFINALEFCRSRPPDKFVYPSSGTVYGASGKSGAASVPSPSNIYGAVKYTHELLAGLYTGEFACVGLRIFMGYGPGEERKGDVASPIFHFLSSMMSGNRPLLWGDGSQSRDVIHVNDVVDSILAATKLPRSGPTAIDVGSGKATSFLAIVRTINEVLGTSIDPEFRPAPSDYVRSTCAEPSTMLHMLGHPIVTLEEGVKDFAHYLETLSESARSPTS
jgi:UDP-glucose 4-epimerase